MSYLSGMLRLDQVLLQMTSRERSGVLEELAALVPELKQDPRQLQAFVKALLERERLQSTGIGDGIALPHTRNALGSFLKRPILVFGRHATGIPFGSIDNKPVQLFFLLAAPNLTEHLKMLAALSRLLRNPTLRERLLQAGSEEDVLRAFSEAEQVSGR